MPYSIKYSKRTENSAIENLNGKIIKLKVYAMIKSNSNLILL